MRILHWVLPFFAFLFAPLIPGIINRVKAIFAGKRGPTILQPYYDIWRLLHKGFTYSSTTSLLFRIAPSVVLACMALVVAFLPWGRIASPVHFAGDVFLVAYVLGLARFFTVISAMDTGSSFEGMGASREVQFAALSEPSLFIGLLVLAEFSGKISLSAMISGMSSDVWQSSGVGLIIVAGSWFMLLLTENSRMPVDDPNTHLELTMIHEVMVLDNSGPDFGFILYASALKLWIFSALIVSLMFPVNSFPLWAQPLLFLSGIVLIAIAIGIVESVMGRLKLLQIPKVLIGSAVLSLFALIFRVLG